MKVLVFVSMLALAACGGNSGAPVSPAAPPPAAPQWQTVTLAADFAGRDGAGAVSLNGTTYLLGGWRWASAGDDSLGGFPQTGVTGCCTTSEVWSTTDGASWQFLGAAPWEGRHMAGWLAFNGKIWVLGGDDNHGHYQPDVWSSPDGINWTQVATNVPWGNRVLHYVAALNGRMYVMGGQTLPELIPGDTSAPEYYQDVWSSADGVTWEQVGNLPAAVGMICGSVTFNGQIWVIGGGEYGDGVEYNEVWSSADGVSWTKHANAPWSARSYHNALAYNGTMYVLAGSDSSAVYLNDVWQSTDGEHWTQQTAAAPWDGRHAATVFGLNDAIYITAGTDNSQVSRNDIWRLQ